MATYYTKVTIVGPAGMPTPLSATSIRCRQVILQNNTSPGHTMAIGDKTVNLANSIGLQLNPLGTNSAAIANYTFGPFNADNLDLSQIYVDGTTNDHLDVMYVK